MAALIATCFVVRTRDLAVFAPVMACAFLVIALGASLLAHLAEVDVAIGSDGLRIGPDRFVAFGELTRVEVDGDRVALVTAARTEIFYLRPGAVLRALAATLTTLMRVQRYKALLPGRDESPVSRGEVARNASQALRTAWEAFRARQVEVTELETRLRVETAQVGGYRVGTVGEEELARAVAAPGLPPRMRIEAARALLEANPARATRVAEEAAELTGDDRLASELRAVVKT